MSYRVEIAKQGRAGCQNAPCKAEGIKIGKGEFRLGIWVTFPGTDRSSFRWKHWGCVSGAQLQHLREYLKQGDPKGEYQWDYMDGLDELPDEYQEKFKTAIIEGKIADEDWNGDPEYNVLGQKGTQARTKKVKESPEGEEDVNGEPVPTPAPKKRGRAKKVEDEDEEETKPVKKRARKTKKEDEEEGVMPAAYKGKTKKPAKKEVPEDEVKEEEYEAESKPVKKPRARKHKKEESDDESAVKQEDESPVAAKPAKAKKSRAKKVKQESDEDAASEADVKPSKKARGKKATKKENPQSIKDEADVSDFDTKPVNKARGRKSKKETVKQEEEENSDATPAKPIRSSRATRAAKREGVETKSEPAEDDPADVKPSKKKRGKSAKVKNEDDASPGNGVKAEPNGNETHAKTQSKRKNSLGVSASKASKDAEQGDLIPGVDNDFLFKNFQKMIRRGEAEDGDWEGYLEEMREGRR